MGPSGWVSKEFSVSDELQTRWSIEAGNKQTSELLQQLAEHAANETQARLAAEARETERDKRENVLFWVAIAGLIFSIIAAVAGILALT